MSSAFPKGAEPRFVKICTCFLFSAAASCKNNTDVDLLSSFLLLRRCRALMEVIHSSRISLASRRAVLGDAFLNLCKASTQARESVISWLSLALELNSDRQKVLFSSFEFQVIHPRRITVSKKCIDATATRSLLVAWVRAFLGFHFFDSLLAIS